MHRAPASKRFIDTGLLAGLPALAAQHLPAKRWLMVCDDITWYVAGNAVKEALTSASCSVEVVSFGKFVSPLRAHVDKVLAQAGDCDALLAIGSGTLNDITKCAAALANKPYVVVATAASMNGFSSATSSLEQDGFKLSYAARPPVMVMADPTILAAAPKRLTRAGLGDTLCRTTVEADMYLSHIVLNTPYPQHLFDRMRAHEAELMSNASALRSGDAAAVSKLMIALLDAGDAMAEYGSSSPASQGEHMIAHTLELLYGEELRSYYHGEIIAYTAQSMSKLQHKMLLKPLSFKALPKVETQILRLFGKKLGPQMAENYAKKLLEAEQIEALQARMEKDWPEVKARFQEIMLPSISLERIYGQSGCATRAQDIGVDEDRYRNACASAHLTRDRFTFLDLAVMSDKRAA